MARQFMPVVTVVGGVLVVLALSVETNRVVAAEPAVECSLPLFDPRWIVPTVNEPNDEMFVAARQRAYQDQGLPALPQMRPLIVGQQVLTRTMTGLIAVDFKSGKRIWEFPWDADVPVRVPDRNLRTGITVDLRKAELDQRLFVDAPYHQLSSDGQSVFLLDELGYAIPSAMPMAPPVAAPRQGLRDPDLPKSFNNLVALDLKSEGGMRWIIGGSDGRDEPKLAGAFFLGAPLPVEGLLYVLAEIQAKLFLVVLDAKSGKQAWSLELHDCDKHGIVVDIRRRLAGATPAMASGIVLCPTASGVMYGVDVKVHKVQWRSAHDVMGLTPNSIRLDIWPNSMHAVGGRWEQAGMFVTGERVLLAPLESGSLHCVDSRTGELLWPEPRPRGESLFIAGIHGEHAILVGKHEVVAVKLSDGSAAWAEPVKFEAMPSGRGFLCGRHYFLPTTASELLKIDVAEGKIVERARTDRVLGNLVAYQDQILSHGVDVLATYYQREPLRKRVAQSLKENPDDAEAMELQVKLLLTEGRQREALAMLQRARDLRPQSVSIRTLFIRETLAGLRRDFAAYHKAAAAVEPLIDSYEQRAEYLRLLAAGLEGNGETIAAFHALLKLNDLTKSDSRLGVDAKLEQVEPSLQSRNVRIVNASLARLRAAATAEERAQMDKLIQDRFDAAIKP